MKNYVKARKKLCHSCRYFVSWKGEQQVFCANNAATGNVLPFILVMYATCEQHMHISPLRRAIERIRNEDTSSDMA